MLYLYLVLVFVLTVLITTVIALITDKNSIPFGSAIAREIKRKQYKKLVKRTLVYTWIVASVMIVIIPVMWMVSASFSPGNKLEDVPVIPNFSEWSIKNYKEIFTTRSSSAQLLPDYWGKFLVTLQVAIITTVITIVVSTLTGIALARYKFKAKKPVLLSMVALQMFPSFFAMLALFMIFRTFGILNRPTALALVYASGSIPYNAFIIRGYMRNIPKSLDEAAFVDGASNLQLFTKILVPLSLPILGFIAVTAFMAPWMEYILANELLPTNGTIAPYLLPMANYKDQAYAPLEFFAGALFLALPIMIVQIYMQKYVVGGLMSGADKG